MEKLFFVWIIADYWDPVNLFETETIFKEKLKNRACNLCTFSDAISIQLPSSLCFSSSGLPLKTSSSSFLRSASLLNSPQS